MLIFVFFWKPANKVYEVNIYTESKDSYLIEDFNNDLDNNYWSIIDGGETYNNELQYYTPKNISINNGILEIEAKKETYQECDYTSGLINTKNKFEFQYGKIIFRAKPAYGNGLVSAIWLLPADGSLYPEVDILEALGNDNTIWTGIHYLDPDSNKQSNFVNVPGANNYSVYEFNWDENEISLSIDNKPIYKTSAGVPNKKMYVIINLSVGGTWAGEPEGSTLPSKFLLDYIIIIPKEVEL